MRIYISGPMTGILDGNQEAFALVFVLFFIAIICYVIKDGGDKA